MTTLIGGGGGDAYERSSVQQLQRLLNDIKRARVKGRKAWKRITELLGDGRLFTAVNGGCRGCGDGIWDPAEVTTDAFCDNCRKPGYILVVVRRMTSGEPYVAQLYLNKRGQLIEGQTATVFESQHQALSVASLFPYHSARVIRVQRGLVR